MSTGGRAEVVLDTNVLVSSALSNGKPFEILQFVSVTSPAIVGELRDVLERDRLPFSDDQVDKLVTKVVSISRVIEPELTVEVVEDDPDDDKILECAIAGAVDCIISGDSHLLDIERHRAVAVYSPDEFLTQLSR